MPDQNPQLQLDALVAEDCLKVYTDRASGTKVDWPRWTDCLADLRPCDTLIIWRVDRLGRNLRDLIDIVTTLQARGVGVRSLSNGLVDTTTAHGALVFGMFALMAEYEAALIGSAPTTGSPPPASRAAARAAGCRAHAGAPAGAPAPAASGRARRVPPNARPSARSFDALRAEAAELAARR